MRRGPGRSDAAKFSTSVPTCARGNIPSSLYYGTARDVEYTDEFGAWWDAIAEGGQDAIDRVVGLVEVRGPHLGPPYSSAITTSRHGHLRERRVQHQGHPIRVLYAFDPRRVAILLLGGDKTGDERWYERCVPIADALYDEHLETLRREGLI